jgi:hypothetical protein
MPDAAGYSVRMSKSLQAKTAATRFDTEVFFDGLPRGDQPRTRPDTSCTGPIAVILREQHGEQNLHRQKADRAWKSW